MRIVYPILIGILFLSGSCNKMFYPATVDSDTVPQDILKSGYIMMIQKTNDNEWDRRSRYSELEKAVKKHYPGAYVLVDNPNDPKYADTSVYRYCISFSHGKGFTSRAPLTTPSTPGGHTVYGYTSHSVVHVVIKDMANGEAKNIGASLSTTKRHVEYLSKYLRKRRM